MTEGLDTDRRIVTVNLKTYREILHLAERQQSRAEAAEAERDRLRGLLAEPTEAMVDAALESINHWYAMSHNVRQVNRDRMRAALVAGLRVMGGNDGKDAA